MAYMTAVIYARYSSSNQREESIEGQIRECTAFAERNGYTILRTYEDRAISGKTDKRPEFQQMIADSKRKLFDTVIVWKVDRFSRDRADSVVYKFALKQSGVRVISATESFSDDPMGKLMEGIMESFAAFYSEELAEKIIRGMTENALKGVWNGGVLPIGYKLDENRHYIPDAATAPHVLEVFKMYAEGRTIKELKDYLDKMGVTTAKGTAVTFNVVQRMLHNRRYIGEYSFKDVVIPNGIPAIVPQDLFDKVQQMLEKNKKAPARAKAEVNYILTTKLRCGHCGVYMCGESGTARNGTTHRYYKCATAKKHKGDCKKKAIKKDYIENLVLTTTREMLMDDDTIEAIVSMLMALQDQENTALPLFEKQLKETEKGIQNIVTAIEKGMFSDALVQRMEALEETKTRLTAQIAAEKLAKPKISAEYFTYWLHQFRDLDMEQEAHRQMLIDTFVNAIYVYDDKILLTFNFKDSTRTITLDEVKAATDESGSSLDCKAVPTKNTTRWVVFFVGTPEGWTRKGGTSPQTGEKSVQWTLFSPWESP